MKFGVFLLLQVLVTGAAVFAYDAIRDRNTPTVEAPRPADIVRERPEVVQTPTLAGTGWSELLRRVEALEAKPSAGTHVGVIPGITEVPDASSGVTGLPTEATAPETGDGAAPALTQFDEKQIAKFRLLLDEVEKRRREERQLENFRDLMKRIEVNLTAEQEKGVIAARTAYGEKRAEMFRTIRTEGRTDGNRTDGGRTAAGDRESRQAMAKDLRDEYGRALEAVVPAADAQKILDATARFPQDSRQRGPGPMGGFTPPDATDGGR
jgi:hypothetical protein